MERFVPKLTEAELAARERSTRLYQQNVLEPLEAEYRRAIWRNYRNSSHAPIT